MATTEKKRVFISYSRKDYVNEDNSHIEGSLVQQVKDILTANGISFWFDEEGIYTGSDFMSVIATAIEEADAFLFISTEHSNASEWVQKEIACANELGKWIIPVKAVEKYPATISIWLAGKDYIDYYHNHDSLARLGDVIRQKLDEIDQVRAKIEHNNEIAEERRLREEEKQLKTTLTQYAIYLEKMEAELRELLQRQEMLATDIAMRQTNIELLKLERDKIDKKYQVVMEKVSTPKESGNGSNVVVSTPEVDLAEVKSDEEIASEDKTARRDGGETATADTAVASDTPTAEAEPATPARPKRTPAEEIGALMSMMSILHPQKAEDKSATEATTTEATTTEGETPASE